MRLIARALVTATALAVLSMLGPAATASSPAQDERPQLTTAEHRAGQVTGGRCGSGHGPQVDCKEASPSAGGAPSGDVTAPADRATRPALALLGLLAGTLVTATAWMRRYRRPREAV
jgi:hypothetical protein